MFRQVAQNTCAMLIARSNAPAVCQGVRNMSVEGVKSFKDRESAAENLYFSKEDERLLRQLLQKMKSQADATDASAAAHNSAEGKSLEAIVNKYKVSEEDFQALIKWKHS